MSSDTTPAAVEALTDAEYVLSMIDETFASVPQIKAHHDRIRRIAAALAHQPPAAMQAKREPQWQPIDTAPKDGTAIYVIVADAKRPEAGVAHWNEGWHGGSAEDWEGAEDPIGHFGVYPSPTHWMPLPTPPIGAAGEGAEQ